MQNFDCIGMCANSLVNPVENWGYRDEEEDELSTLVPRTIVKNSWRMSFKRREMMVFFTYCWPPKCLRVSQWEAWSWGFRSFLFHQAGACNKSVIGGACSGDGRRWERKRKKMSTGREKRKREKQLRWSIGERESSNWALQKLKKKKNQSKVLKLL